MSTCDINRINKIAQKSLEDYVGMKITEFVKIEILFRLCERIGCWSNVDEFYLLLSGLDTVYDYSMSKDNFLISNARIVLKTMGQLKVYRDALRAYMESCDSEVCRYYIEDNILKINKCPLTIYEERVDDYDAVLENLHETELKYTDAKAENSYFSLVNEKEIVFQLQDMGKVQFEEPVIRSRKGTDIDISLEDILAAADELDTCEQNNNRKHKAYRRTLLEDNIYKICNGEKIPIQNLNLHGVINLAGQVAAGKSTLADCLAKALSSKGYRLVIIQPDVNHVLEKASFYEQLGINTAVFIGKSNLYAHIESQLDQRIYLDKWAAKYLEQPCLLSLMTEKPDVIIPYGKEPCFTLRKTEERYGGKTYTCPYYNICPVTENHRKIGSADIVVTNIHAFCLSSFGKKKKIFMNYAITNFDLVIIDEIDNVLCTLDSIFAPSIGANDYLKSCNRFRNSYQNGSFQENKKWRNEKFDCYSLIGRFEVLLKKLSGEIDNNDTGWTKSELKHFSALFLLKKLQKSDENPDGLPDSMWKLFYAMLSPISEDAYMELLSMIEQKEYDETYLRNKLKEIYLTVNKQSKAPADWDMVRHRTWKKIWFLLIVIDFEQRYRQISNSVANLPDSPPELQKILSQSLYKQQCIMPAAPIGNTFAIEIKDDDIYMTKQFAIGRALALCMDRLSVNSDGHENGASVLMMSGTGYMPGSTQYHVSDKVDYIVEAQQEKRNYIAKTSIVDCAGYGSDRYCVSGVSDKYKNQNLRNLIKIRSKVLRERIMDSDNILVIVNSYEQCRVAYDEICKVIGQLEKMLIHDGDSLDPAYKIQYLVPGTFDHDGTDGKTTRKNLTSFEKGIMIAPACIIERGHNIVDSFGNARLDTVMYYVRPMSNPDSYDLHVQKVNGYIMNHFNKRIAADRIAVAEELRKTAFARYAKLNHIKGGLSDLPVEMQIDAVASFFVTFDQIFGRLCRLGTPIKEKPIKIYLMDGAFHAGNDTGFDMISSLEEYLRNIMNGKNAVVAKTLYEPFYLALKGRK